MFLIGLTGGIAAGKSTVAAHWVSLGAIEIDADVVAREVVEPGTKGLAQIIEKFGSGVLAGDGFLDRTKLGEIIFSNPVLRSELELIIHPLVSERVREKLAALPEDSMVVYTVPLLVEANVDLPFDVVVTVEAPEQDRVERLMKSRGMTKEQSEARIKAQASSLERASRADYILNSNQPLVSLLKDASNLWGRFIQLSKGKK